jgi:probable addiction module antidote protein
MPVLGRFRLNNKRPFITGGSRDALASGNAGYVAETLGVIARARGMTEVAREAGVTREARCTRSSARTATLG